VSVRVKVGPAADHLNEIGAVALGLQKHGTLAGAQIDRSSLSWADAPRHFPWHGHCEPRLARAAEVGPTGRRVGSSGNNQVDRATRISENRGTPRSTGEGRTACF
jgi:hypothetical protein